MEITPSIDRVNADYAAQNFDLAGQLLQQLLIDPTVLDGLPDGASMIALPYDDSALTWHNIGIALRISERGETIYLRRANTPEPQQGRRFVCLIPGFDRTRLLLSVDDATNALTFVFASAGETERFPIGEESALLLARGTTDVVGYIVPGSRLDHRRHDVNAADPSRRPQSTYHINDLVAAFTAIVDDLMPHAA